MKRLLILICFILVVTNISPMMLFAQDDGGDDEPTTMGWWEECSEPSLTGEVNVGVIFSLTGGASVYGNNQTHGVVVAMNEINDTGYLGDAELVFIFVDGGSDAETATSAMEQLIDEDEVVAILGPTLSTQAFEADPLAQEAGIPVMGVSNTATGITDMGDYVFRDSLPESVVIPGTLEQAVEILGIETVSVLYSSNDDFSVSGYEVFSSTLEEMEIEVLVTQDFEIGEDDFEDILLDVLFDEPDALVVSTLAVEAIEIIRQARDLGYMGPIIGGNGFNSPAIPEEVRADGNGVIAGTAWHSTNESPLNTAFVEMFMDQYDLPPDQFAAQAYTGAWLMATAIRCADSTDPADIRDALAEIEDFASPLGSFSFDEDRNPVHDPIAQIMIDGEFRILSEDTVAEVFSEE